jgi:hypothetical protein
LLLLWGDLHDDNKYCAAATARGKGAAAAADDDDNDDGDAVDVNASIQLYTRKNCMYDCT